MGATDTVLQEAGWSRDLRSIPDPCVTLSPEP